MLDLKQKYTIVIVTHNMQQACRIADDTAHFHMGEVLESQSTEALFNNPKNDITRDYINGRFG
jgi:phosphate transport system ATP-binding protein